MAKYTKKWDKEFTKKYSDAIKELQSLNKRGSFNIRTQLVS